MQQRARELAIDGEHVGERETSKLRASEHNPMQLATCDAEMCGNLAGHICINDSLILPLVVWRDR